PPKRPEIGIYNATGTRLDGSGPVTVAAGTPLVLRHSVQDLETTHSQIPFAGFVLIAADGRNVALNPANTGDPSLGQSAYDPAAPMGITHLLDFKRAWTVPASLPLWDRATGMTTNVT